MWRRQPCQLAAIASAAMAAVRRSMTPVDVLTQLQLGMTPPPTTQRAFLLEYFALELEQRGITEARLLAMDNRLCTSLMRSLVYTEYLAVPFRVYTFDMEFTGPPVFTAEGPTEDITEVGLYSPAREATFASLVQPACGRATRSEVVELTHITDDMLATAPPFAHVWEQFLAFVNTPEPHELPGADARILLLSHGGKLADVSLIRWTLEKHHLTLPSNFIFADTIHLIRDAHRRRPVTVDRHPPSWKLSDLVQWLHIAPTLPAHRAGNDAKMTWDALYHTLLRYGDDEMTPREQLVPRFFDEEAKRLMRERMLLRHRTRGAAAAAAAAAAAMLSGGEQAEGGSYVVADVHKPVELRSSVAGGGGGAAGDGADGGGSGAADVLDLDFDDIFRNNNNNNSASGGGAQTAATTATTPATEVAAAATATTRSTADARMHSRDECLSLSSSQPPHKGDSGSDDDVAAVSSDTHNDDSSGSSSSAAAHTPQSRRRRKKARATTTTTSTTVQQTYSL